MGGPWQRLKRAFGLAPTGPPRRPLGSNAVELEPPDESEDLDPRGRET